VHHRLVAERNHARREAMSMSMGEESHLMDGVPDRLRKDLAGTFKTLQKDPEDGQARRRLAEQVETLLGVEPGT
jgi:hypothetical protein